MEVCCASPSRLNFESDVCSTSRQHPPGRAGRLSRLKFASKNEESRFKFQCATSREPSRTTEIVSGPCTCESALQFAGPQDAWADRSHSRVRLTKRSNSGRSPCQVAFVVHSVLPPKLAAGRATSLGPTIPPVRKKKSRKKYQIKYNETY